MKKKLNLKSHQQLHTHRDTRKWKTEIFWFQINKISMNTRYRRIGWNDSNDENKKNNLHVDHHHTLDWKWAKNKKKEIETLRVNQHFGCVCVCVWNLSLFFSLFQSQQQQPKQQTFKSFWS